MNLLSSPMEILTTALSVVIFFYLVYRFYKHEWAIKKASLNDVSVEAQNYYGDEYRSILDDIHEAISPFDTAECKARIAIFKMKYWRTEIYGAKDVDVLQAQLKAQEEFIKNTSPSLN